MKKLKIQFLKRDGYDDLAYIYTPPAGKGTTLPPVMFLPGFRSDMEGTKALYLEEQCRNRGQAFIRFDYSGHGVSGGRFEEGTISVWKNDALAILDHLTGGRPVVLVGSSMGGWISLLIARERPDQLTGLVGLAAAPDFTREIEEALSESQKEEMAEKGFISVPNNYSDEPYIFTSALIEDGRQNFFLERDDYNFSFPVRLIQGMKDTDVAWQTAYRIQNVVDGDIKVLPVEEGDHRLSRIQDLVLIDEQVRNLSGLKR